MLRIANRDSSASASASSTLLIHISQMKKIYLIKSHPSFRKQPPPYLGLLFTIALALLSRKLGKFSLREAPNNNSSRCLGSLLAVFIPCSTEELKMIGRPVPVSPRLHCPQKKKKLIRLERVLYPFLSPVRAWTAPLPPPPTCRRGASSTMTSHCRSPFCARAS